MKGVHYSPAATDKLFYCLQKNKDKLQIQALLEAGADVNGTDSKGHFPLMLACSYPTENVANLLVDRGADVNRPDPSNGWTALHFAVFKGWLKLIKVLVKKGANLDAESVNGSVPLMIAASLQNKDAFELLVTYGANVFYHGNRNWTALHFACQSGWLSAVQACLNRNMDVDAQTSPGDTPLRIACDNGKLEVVEYLLKLGADCRLSNLSGKTPFDFLISRFYVEPIKMCIENGAYIKPEEYEVFSYEWALKDFVLGDVKVCSQSIVNKFNSKDLPDLYRILLCAGNLPDIRDLRIVKSSEMAKDVERAVALVKHAKGYVNLSEVRPMVLRIMSVESLLRYHQAVDKGSEVMEKMKKLNIKK